MLINPWKDISGEIVRVFSTNEIANQNTNQFVSKFSKKICMKNLQNNLMNFIGGIFEKIPLGDFSISKISIKTSILPLINIHLRKDFID